MILNAETLIFLWTEFICTCMIKYFVGMVLLPVCWKNATDEVAGDRSGLIPNALMAETEVKMLALLRPGARF